MHVLQVYVLLVRVLQVQSIPVCKIQYAESLPLCHLGAPNQSIFPTYFHGLLDFLYGQLDFLYGQLDFLYGQLDFFYGQLDYFYGQLNTFYMVN